VAHAGPVNCLKVGRKSAGVMVTGGEDKKVNMWAVGKPSAILVRLLTECALHRHRSIPTVSSHAVVEPPSRGAWGIPSRRA
jgi:hypothetical protein